MYYFLLFVFCSGCYLSIFNFQNEKTLKELLIDLIIKIIPNFFNISEEKEKYYINRVSLALDIFILIFGWLILSVRIIKFLIQIFKKIINR